MRIDLLSENDILEVTEIFFESSARKKFSSKKDKEDFFHKYLGFYIHNYSDHFFVAKDDNKVLGYLCSAPDSLRCKSLYHLLEHYHLFEHLFNDYPCHAHMNTHKLSRGLGVGSKLLESFIKSFSNELKGIHIITSPIVRNVDFYLKNGFEKIETIKFKNTDLLFMGKSF